MEKPENLEFVDDISVEIAMGKNERALDTLMFGLKSLLCSSASQITEEQFDYFVERSAAMYLLRTELSRNPASVRSSTCSFCGKGEDQVDVLIAGAAVFICSGCVGICNEVIANSKDRAED